jgi:hypothetical protein
MPRVSKRATWIKFCERIVAKRKSAAHVREVRGVEDGLEDDLDLVTQAKLNEVRGRRYLKRDRYRKARYDKFEEVLQTNKMKDYEFLFHYRVPRTAFWELVDLIKGHEVFAKKRSNRKQAPPAHQLLVLLKFVGTSGNGANKLAISDHFGGIGHGTVRLYIGRAIKALQSLFSEVVSWPDEAEREEIARRIHERFYFPNCLGFIDGTLLPMEFKPSLYGDVYLTRKSNYAVHMLVVCDDQARIRFYTAGWPGSVHDNHTWKLSDLSLRAAEFFSGIQYLLGDSAFSSSAVMIPAFKKVAGHGMLREHEKFNTFLAKPRVISEHSCIGILKGRFQHLKNIRTRIDSKKSLDRILEYIQVCVILHNLLIKHPPPKGWYEDAEDQEELENDYGLQTAMPYVESDYTRRDQLMDYLLDTFTGS